MIGMVVFVSIKMRMQVTECIVTMMVFINCIMRLMDFVECIITMLGLVARMVVRLPTRMAKPVVLAVKVNRVMERPIMRLAVGVHIGRLSLRMIVISLLRSVNARDFLASAFCELRRDLEVFETRLATRVLLGRPIPVRQ